MKEEKIKSAVKAGIAITILAIIIIMVITIMMQYEQEGEKNMPFELSKITIISTAEGMEDATEEGVETGTEGNAWNFNVIQNNDIYFTISKNENYEKEEIIKSVTIKNIQILEEPEIGEVKAYMPNSLDGRRFIYSNEYIIEDELKYKGASKSDEKTLEIGNQGGSFTMSFCNISVGKYESNDEEEIKHDGSLIGKMGRTDEELKFKVSFDLVIELEKKSYKTTIVLDLPCENLIEQGTSSIVITDVEKFIFKREN